MTRALAVLVVGLLASGCSSPSASGPVELPPVTARPSGGGAPSASPSAPAAAPAVEKPALADEATEAGAEAFARYWMAELNAAYVSVDPSRLEAISDAGCATCQAYISSLQKAQREGRDYRGGQSRITSAVAAPGALPNRALILVDHDVDDLRVLDSDGQLLRTVPGEVGTTLSFDLRHNGRRWVAQQVSPE